MHKPISPQMFYYGFPVILLTSIDENNKTNITPISSSWCLGDNVVIGISMQGKAFENIRTCGEVVLNLPDETLWEKIEKIAPTTGKNPVPDYKKSDYQFCADKFEQGGFTAQSSTKVKPSRIKECPLQAEAKVVNVSERDGYAIIELKIVQVHACESLIMDNDKIDPTKWQPLIYNFRHYQGLGDLLGKNFRASR